MDKFCTSPGGVVLPTALNEISLDVADNTKAHYMNKL